MCCPVVVCQWKAELEMRDCSFKLSRPCCNRRSPLLPEFNPAGISDSAETNIMRLADRESQTQRETVGLLSQLALVAVAASWLAPLFTDCNERCGDDIFF